MERIWYNTFTGPYCWPITIPGVVIRRTAKRVVIAMPDKFTRGKIIERFVKPESIEPRFDEMAFDDDCKMFYRLGGAK